MRLALVAAVRCQVGWDAALIGQLLTQVNGCQSALFFACRCLHHLACGNKVDALRDARRMWSVAEKERAVAHLLLATALLENGQLKQAQANFRRGIEQNGSADSLDLLFDYPVPVLLRIGMSVTARRLGQAVEAAQFEMQVVALWR